MTLSLTATAKETPSYTPGAVPLLLTFLLLFAAFEASAKRLEFDVFLEDRPIGSHEFVLQETQGQTQVSINAKFKVKVLFVTAFDYKHTNTETWQGDCLQRIDATTVVNGDTFEVNGDQSASAFELTLAANAEQQPNIACARSFAYWDRSLLLPETQATAGQLSPLLNAQTGEFVPTTLQNIGKGELTIGDQEVEVTRYELRGDDVQVTLAYTNRENENGELEEEWVGLSSKVKGGRTLNYVRTPDSLGQ